MKKIVLSYIQKYWPVLAIALVEGILFLANFQSGTWLIGWDNLYPELSPTLNIKRSFFSVWQEYRSLGYMDGMSHAANFFHDIFRYFLSIFLPLNIVRWVTIMLIHLIGGIGMFVLLSKYVLKNIHTPSKIHSQTTNAISLFGALFYQYNLITIQQFFLPFELFIFHYAFLPWLIYFALSYLETGKRLTLMWFGVMSLLAVPQAHVPTIFIVYAMALGMILAVAILTHISNWKKGLLLIAVTIGINAFWGFPFAYSTLQNADVIANSKNNQMATDDIFYRNLKFGDFQDVAMMKGVVMDYWQYDIKTNQSHFMMHPWLSHTSTPWFSIPAWSFFLIALLGLIHALTTRNKKLFPFAVVTLFAFSMLANDTTGVRWIYRLFQEYVPLFHNIFRFTFTKFSFLYAFGFTIFLTYEIYVLVGALKRKAFQTIMVVGVMISILSYAYPAFSQHFFYENLAAEKPQAYFDLYDFFETKNPNERVALLPIPNYWAWTQNKWNTIGSGFTWYGIPQPTTDRAFDPWSDKNENFYWELDQAIFSEDSEKLENVFEKYDISWIILDKSVVLTSSPKFDYDRYEAILSQSPQIQNVKSFDFIDIYAFKSPHPQKNYVSLLTDVPSVGPSYSYDDDDQAYADLGPYTVSENPDVWYPFRSLLSKKNTSDQRFSVRLESDYISFSSHIPENAKGSYLVLPHIFDDEFFVQSPDSYIISPYTAELFLDDEKIYHIDASDDSERVVLRIDDFEKGILEIRIPTIDTNIYNSTRKEDLISQVYEGCARDPKGLANLSQTGGGLTFVSVNSNNCANVDISSASQRYGYAFFVESRNSPIKGLYFNVINKTTRKSDLETYLPHDGNTGSYTFILPPREYYGLGYSMSFNNISFGRETVENTLTSVKAFQIPYRLLKQIKISKSLDLPTMASAMSIETNTIVNSSKYIVSLPSQVPPNSILYFSQSFDPGWKAYTISCNTSHISCSIRKTFPMLFGTELTDHVLVNNWANAWKLNRDTCNANRDTCTIVIVFWPQYLQYAGFGLLGVTIIILAILNFRETKHQSLV